MKNILKIATAALLCSVISNGAFAYTYEVEVRNDQLSRPFVQRIADDVASSRDAPNPSVPAPWIVQFQEMGHGSDGLYIISTSLVTPHGSDVVVRCTHYEYGIVSDAGHLAEDLNAGMRAGLQYIASSSDCRR
jgi:hypothetical protein